MLKISQPFEISEGIIIPKPTNNWVKNTSVSEETNILHPIRKEPSNDPQIIENIHLYFSALKKAQNRHGKNNCKNR